MSATADAISTYYAAQVNASDLDAGQKNYALLCLAQWVAAEDALTTAIGTSIASYSISGRSVSRVTQSNQFAAAQNARGRFFEACHGFVTYADIHDADESIMEAVS